MAPFGQPVATTNDMGHKGRGNMLVPITVVIIAHHDNVVVFLASARLTEEIFIIQSLGNDGFYQLFGTVDNFCILLKMARTHSRHKEESLCWRHCNMTDIVTTFCT